MEKIYSELTKQSYYSKEAKEADEKVYQEQLAEKEKKEQALKETREARVKEFNEAVGKLEDLKKEYNKKYKKKKKELEKELEDYYEEISKEYLEKRAEIKKVIDEFNKDYPNGVFITYKNGKANTPLEKVLNDFLNDSFFFNVFSPFGNLLISDSKKKH